MFGGIPGGKPGGIMPGGGPPWPCKLLIICWSNSGEKFGGMPGGGANCGGAMPGERPIIEEFCIARAGGAQRRRVRVAASLGCASGVRSAASPRAVPLNRRPCFFSAFARMPQRPRSLWGGSLSTEPARLLGPEWLRAAKRHTYTRTYNDVLHRIATQSSQECWDVVARRRGRGLLAPSAHRTPAPSCHEGCGRCRRQARTPLRGATEASKPAPRGVATVAQLHR